MRVTRDHNYAKPQSKYLLAKLMERYRIMYILEWGARKQSYIWPCMHGVHLPHASSSHSVSIITAAYKVAALMKTINYAPQ